jgi:penicillin amidase
MDLSARDILLKLGAGERIESVRAAAGLTGEGFDLWWRDELAARTPQMGGRKSVQVEGDVDIVRDDWGVPHVFARSDEDLFFGYGLAMAQDRLWQLDFYRRKASGRLAEVLGPEGLERDVAARVVGISRIAAEQEKMLPAETMRRLEAFSRGINAAMMESKNHLPIEFALLGYEPEPWSPLDSVAIWGEFRWYLTGRLPVIALPELAKRTLGDGPLYRAFLTPEAGEESIVPVGSYPSEPAAAELFGNGVGDAEEGAGSNNWVIGGARTASGSPLVASDPHIAFGSVSCWYEVHLSGGSFNVAGAGYVGVPGVIFGRNERVAWGVTNNICSQRDLYQEKTDPQRPGHFLYDGEWEPAAELTERIFVKGGVTVEKKVRFSRNGPVVDELLPAPARHTGPVSLRWVGSSFSDELSSMHDANRAESCDQFREALRGWQVPTWSFGFADVEGHIGYQCAGRIPIRKGWDRGYRPGWDPDHQWRELVPFDGLPALADPPEAWVRSANNRPAPEDFPYPLSGTWSSGHRARRIRQMIEEKDRLSRQDLARMQMDVLSLRALDALPALLRLLAGSADQRVTSAAAYLRSWDGRMEPDRVAASIFEFFHERWCQAVAAERFEPESISLVAAAIGGLALELLSADHHGWFRRRPREEVALAAMSRALDDLEGRLGTDMSSWTWGRVHTVRLDHHLSDVGDLGRLLSRGGSPVGGSGTTVCNTGHDPNYMASLGANWRLNADLSESPAGLWAVDAAGQSGNPGSPHYCDQLPEWLAGRHHYLPLDRGRLEARSESVLHLEPSG